MKHQTNVVSLQTFEPNTEKGLAPEMHFRSVVTNLSPNPGVEILRYGWRRKDILSLGQGEGCAPTPENVCKAASDALAAGKTFYGPVLGHVELRQELSNYYSNIYNLSIPTNRIFVTGSGTTAMHLALTAVLDEGDDVVAVTPIWKNLLGAIEIAQANTIQVALEQEEDNSWKLNMDKLFASCTSKTRVILLVSPSNPTGWALSKEEMREILDFARERNIWIISDEVYGRIVYDADRAPSFLDVADEDDLVLTVNSFSKTWAMTGWRLGWIVGPAKSEAVIRDLALYDNMGPASFIQFAAIEALRHGEDFIKEQKALWQSNRDLIVERFEKMGNIELSPIGATFYAFFRVKGEDDCLALARRLIDEEALSLAPGCAFGLCCKSYIRLCFAVSQRKLNDALDRLERAVCK